MAQVARKEIKDQGTHESFGQKRGVNDVIKDVDIKAQYVDDARK